MKPQYMTFRVSDYIELESQLNWYAHTSWEVVSILHTYEGYVVVMQDMEVKK